MAPLRRIPRRILLLAGAGIAAALIAVIAYESGALGALERSTVDARFDVRGNRAADNGIVIVGVDDKSFSAYGRPPIPRHYIAQALDRIRAARPRLIVVDLRFIGPTNRKDDGALRASIARNGPLVLGTKDDSPQPVPIMGQSHLRGAVLAATDFDKDPDGVARRMMYAPIQLKTVAVAAAELAARTRISESNFPDNHAWVDFRGPPGTFPRLSMVDVVRGQAASGSLAGRIVLIGETDPGSPDEWSTPISSNPMPGVELHANAISTILDGFPLTAAGGLLNVLLIFGMAAMPPLLVARRMPSLYMLLAALGLLVLYLVFAQVLFGAGTIVAVAGPVLALVLSAAGAAAVDFLLERRRSEELEEQFGDIATGPAKYFVCYRRDQSSWPAQILRDELTKSLGESSVFMDMDSIAAGQDWPERIERAIDACDVVLVLIGPQWLDVRDKDGGGRRIDDPRDWVRLEIEAGLRQEKATVVPVLVDNAQMPNESELPESIKPLARRNAITLSATAWNSDIQKLVESIRTGRLRDHVLRRPGREAGAGRAP